MNKPQRKYNYTVLAKNLAVELHRNQRLGLSSRQIMYRFEIGSTATVRAVIRHGNILLKDRGYVIQYDPSERAYYLRRDGDLEYGRRHKSRHIKTRLLSLREEVLAMRNSYAEGTSERNQASMILRQCDRLIEDMEQLV